MKMHWIRKNLISISLWGIITLLVLVNVLLLQQNSSLRSELERYQPPKLETGDKVSGFAAKNLNGETVRIDFSKNTNKRFLLYFTPTCQYCKQQFPEWKELILQSKDKNIELFGIVSENESKATIEKYLNSFDCGENSETPLQVLFVSNEILKNYKLNLTPTTILVSADGIVEQSWVGKADNFN